MEEYKKVTLESYRQNANVFGTHFKGVFNLEKRMEFNKFIQLLPGKNILDVGCGAGDHSLWFQQNGLNVTSSDLSPEMVEIAREKGVDAIVKDMEKMDFNE